MNDRLIKKVLNLKEDYTLNLEEGKDDEELEVLEEGEFFKKCWKDTCTKVEKIAYSKTLKSLEKFETIECLNKLFNSSEKDLPVLKEKCEEKYGEQFLEDKNFKKNLNEILVNQFDTIFNKQCIDNKDKFKIVENGKEVMTIDLEDNQIVAVYTNSKGGEGGTRQKDGGGRPAQNLTKFFEEKFKKEQTITNHIMEDLSKIKKEEPNKEVKKEKETNNDFEKEKTEQIFKSLEVVGIDPPTDLSEVKLVKTFANIEEGTEISAACGKYVDKVEECAKKENKDPVAVLKSLQELLEVLTSAFNVTESKTVKDAVDAAASKIGEEEILKLAGCSEYAKDLEITNTEEKKESFTKDTSYKKFTEEDEADEEDKEKNDQSKSDDTLSAFQVASKTDEGISKFLDNKDFDQLENVLTGSLEKHGLPNMLKVLNALAMGKFPNIGKYFSENDDLRSDAKDIYAHYLILILNEHYQSVFKAHSVEGGNDQNAGITNPKTASDLLKKFGALVNNHVENEYSQALQSFISMDGLTNNANGYIMNIRHALVSTLGYAVILVNQDLAVKNTNDLVRWRKSDCVKAHKAFDEALKEELKHCFEVMKEKKFKIKTKEGEREVPIKNYMFDVQIPRRFKKVLNAGNDDFNDFITQYYAEDIKEDVEIKSSPKLSNYFGSVAGDKKDASLKYKELDADAATKDVKEDEEASIETFIENTGLTGEAAEIMRSEQELKDNNNEPQPDSKEEDSESDKDQAPQTQEGKGDEETKENK